MDYKKYADMGLTQAQTARVCGVSRQCVSEYARRSGIVFTKSKQRGIAYKGFESRSAYARKEGVTPQAVHNRIVRSNA